MSIPSIVEAKLSEHMWQRGSESKVDEALSALGIDRSSSFAEFFRRYWGPFHSEKIAHELLDPVEQDESITSATQSVREEFVFSERFVVISTLTGMSVLVYDSEADKVFDVDFEGGEELLQSGELAPRWESWNDFVADYFGQ